MRSRKENEPSLEDLLDLIEQVSLLIEDNNQNMKDCYKLLKDIQKHVAPKRKSLLSRAITKLLNKK